MGDCVLALDEGTSSARAVLFDKDVQELGVAQQSFTTRFPQQGWVEQDPTEIWQTQKDVLNQVLSNARMTWSDVHAVGITNQRETTLIWDKNTAEPIGPAIVWQCRRTTEVCERIKATEAAGRIQQQTGLVVDAYFSATKIAWLLDHVQDARLRAEAGELLFGTIDTWLIYQLTKGKSHVIDRTNASRTMLMDLETGDWSEELLSYFEIPRTLLPEIVPSTGICAFTDGDEFGHEVPIAGIAGDQQAALVGQGCTREGQAKNTYGTGCFLLMHSGSKIARSRNQLLSTAAADTNGGSNAYALEGSVFDAGTVMQWLRDELGLVQDVAESEAFAESIDDTEGVSILPAFTGLGAPHWKPHVRGGIVGLTRGTTKAHIVRAALESIAFQTKDLVDAMVADTGVPIPELRVDGGAANNGFLMQFQADILGVPVRRPEYVETTVKGAAVLAGLATGFYREIDTGTTAKIFEPRMKESLRRTKCDAWQEVVQQMIGSNLNEPNSC